MINSQHSNYLMYFGRSLVSVVSICFFAAADIFGQTTLGSITADSISGCKVTLNVCSNEVIRLTPTDQTNFTNFKWYYSSVSSGNLIDAAAVSSGSFNVNSSSVLPVLKINTPLTTQTLVYIITADYVSPAGCPAKNDTIVLNVKALPIVSIAETDNSCTVDDGKILSGGSATLTASGGTSYSWSNSLGTGSVKTVSPTVTTLYSATVTDGNGCTAVAQYQVTVVDPPGLSFTKTDVDCKGNSTGSIDLSVTSGAGPYTYVWSNGATTQDISGLSANTYSVTMTDVNGCSTVQSVTITEPNTLSATVSNTPVTCNSANDGTITVSSPTGGYGTYEYRLDSGSWQSSGSFTALAPATYSVQIRDAAKSACVIVLGNQVITQPDTLKATVNSTNVTCYDAKDGSISIVSPSGGYGTYQYRLNSGSWQSTGTFTNLIPGSYTVQIRDAAHTSCVITLGTKVITQPAPPRPIPLLIEKL